MTIEAETARRIVNEERVTRILARTGGELIHPDHYALREAMRLAVLAAIDQVTADRYGKRIMSDAELPALFRTVDGIAERVFLKGSGL